MTSLIVGMRRNRLLYGGISDKGNGKEAGVTEELKATDMMRLIGLMNNIRACADEIVLNDIMYS